MRQFEQLFGSDELLVIGWDRSRLGDPALQRLREQLLSPDISDKQRRRFFSNVWTGDTVMSFMQAEPLNLTSQQSRARMRGWILGEHEETVAIAIVSPEGKEDRHAAVNFARRVTAELTDRPQEAIHLAGTTMNAVAIDEASKASLMRLNVFSALICLLILAICTRRATVAIAIFSIAVYNQLIAMSLIYYTGGKMDNVLLLTANLAGVLSMSASIHVFGYYQVGLRNSKEGLPIRYAFRSAVLPTCLAALTTGVGFISLRVSDIVPVRNFGVYSAIAAPLAVMLTLWFLCILLRILHDRSDSRLTNKIPGMRGAAAHTFPRKQLRYWPIILLVSISCMLAGGSGIFGIRASVGLHDLLPDDDKLLSDYRWLENEIGPLVPVEVVVRVPTTDESSLLSELQLVAMLRSQLLAIQGVDSALSAVNFVPPIPRPSALRGLRGMITKSSFEARLNRSLDEFVELSMLCLKEDERAWRISVRVYGGEEQDYSELLANIESETKRVLHESANPEVEAFVSGMVPVATKAQHRLLKDFARSFITAVFIIGCTLAIVLRSIVAGLLTMLPNIAPAAIVFGTMGWLACPTEIGGVMTASAVLGIAVDDSLHLIMAFRKAYQRSGNRSQAVQEALRICGPAMINTSLVCGLGMLVFALSPFTPIAQFAWLLFALLAVALVADLVFLPAILQCPLGSLFARGRRRT